jgi:DNA-binding ferritin-like protein (Dps family)
MKKTVIIIGGLAIIGVGAYFYFRPKATLGANVGLGGLGNLNSGTSTSLPSAGTQLSTPQQVEELAMKIATARELTKRICDLKKQYKITSTETDKYMNFLGLGNTNYLSTIPRNTISLLQQTVARKRAIEEVVDSMKKLKELGYKEDNCKTVKVV